ncbi:molybdenum ABC transporter ATP-binding protein [Desulfobulbus rhabdoformis]|jgi:molybdate transport system ATP-binding protein|uniref:molybdenum ABC transporter ATP-binding protein n=1 Tax=Desulfobulbus rhabdoformis TaxID=34032 RepID=UPI001963752D|nr:molybdenum ABC transporter ATP-binding protein [Desulfobulbus rhabdoformis]MBM9616367.1 molybdenum ABC transporter ATP-binding protein [Desulfobulbus rhabdoformis]
MNNSINLCFNTSFDDFSLDVNLTLPSRGISALFGHSGCGKTTLLRCIAGLQPAEGHLTVEEEVWQDTNRFMPVHQRSLAYVFQEASLFPHLSVKKNLLYGFERIPKEQRRVAFDDAVSWLGLEELLDRNPDKLSGGQRQRVAIARALLVSPRLLLMDEPLAALDIKSKKEILPYLERLHDDLDIPVIYVTHSPAEVSRLADYLVVLDGGRVIASGPLADTLSRLDLPFKFGDDTAVVLGCTVGEVDNHWHLVRVDFPDGSLWLRDQGVSVGQHVRVRVFARDVSLAENPGKSSIQNVLRGRVDALGEDEHPGLMLVRVRIGSSILLARVTRRAAATIGIQQDMTIWVQVKSVALVE